MIPLRAGPPDWPRIDRNLCEIYGMTPSAIDALTLPEIAVLCLPAKKEDTSGPGMSDAELDAYIRRQKTMTPLERLAQARRRTGRG